MHTSPYASGKHITNGYLKKLFGITFLLPLIFGSTSVFSTGCSVDLLLTTSEVDASVPITESIESTGANSNRYTRTIKREHPADNTSYSFTYSQGDGDEVGAEFLVERFSKGMSTKSGWKVLLTDLFESAARAKKIKGGNGDLFSDTNIMPTSITHQDIINAPFLDTHNVYSRLYRAKHKAEIPETIFRSNTGVGSELLDAYFEETMTQTGTNGNSTRISLDYLNQVQNTNFQINSFKFEDMVDLTFYVTGH